MNTEALLDAFTKIWNGRDAYPPKVKRGDQQIILESSRPVTLGITRGRHVLWRPFRGRRRRGDSIRVELRVGGTRCGAHRRGGWHARCRVRVRHARGPTGNDFPQPDAGEQGLYRQKPRGLGFSAALSSRSLRSFSFSSATTC